MRMGVYDLKSRNPYPEHITDAQWWFWEQLQALAPGTQLGGFYADKAGYHNKRRNLVRQGRDHGVNDSDTDYSIRRAVDRKGPDDKSAGCDWSFPEAWGRDYTRAAKFGRRVKAAFDRRDGRLAGWREFLGQIDTDKSVAGEGLDFHTWTTRTPDSSHETHHHFSEDREQVASFENKAKMISILAGYDSLAAWLAAQEGEDDMQQSDKLDRTTANKNRDIGDVFYDSANMHDYLHGNPAAVNKPAPDSPIGKLIAIPGRLDALEQKLAALAASPPGTVRITDEQLERVLRKVVGSVDGATPQG